MRHINLSQTESIFKALVDAFIPKTPKLAKKAGANQLFGALAFCTDEYHIWSLNYNLTIAIFRIRIRVKMANATARMLEIAAKQLVSMGENKVPINRTRFNKGGAFVALAPEDRFRAINLLEQLRVDLSKLPLPFRNTPDLVLSFVDAINIFTTLGYYSEWAGYGSSRTQKPSKRKLLYFPASWEQIGYPGPSKGSRALRGFLEKNRE